MISRFIEKAYSAVTSVKFETLLWIIAGSYAAVFVLTLILCLCLRAIRCASKRPFLCLTNAYAAVVLAAFLTSGDVPQAIFAAALFWCAGYLAYGLLCLMTGKKKEPASVRSAVSAMPTAIPQRTGFRADAPCAKSSLRLEHAVSVTDKLLQKNLGKSDRQELEKLKNTLAVLQLKGTLSPAESEILNENFNALLKLMAKYNV